MSRVYLKRYAADPWHEVVTDAKDEVRFTFTFDNLTNPTNYVSETSYSLKLPRCPENNLFFGEFCRLDSVIVAGGYDPTQKMQYLVLDTAGMIVSTGDAVISEINGSEYVLSLVGSQARLFRRLLNAGYDTAKAAEDSEYTLMFDWLTKTKVGSMVFDGLPNRLFNKQVAASWLVDNPVWGWNDLLQADLKTTYGLTDYNDITETMAFIASLVGFAPTAQGRPKGLDTKQWLTEVDGIIMPQPVFGSGVEVDEGTIEAQMGEYRSYLQQPFVYVWRLWQIFQQDFAAITGGYSLILDDGWFNASNSALARLVYMLPKVYGETTYDTTKTAEGWTLTRDLPNVPDIDTPGGLPTVAGLDAVELTGTTAVDGLSASDAGQVTVDGAIDIYFKPYSLDPTIDYYFSFWNPIVVEVVVRSNGADVTTRTFAVVPLPEDGVINGEEITLDYLNTLPFYKAMLDGFAAQGMTIATATYTPWDVLHMPHLALSLPMHTNGSLEHASVAVTAHFGNDYCPFFRTDGAQLNNFYRSSGAGQQNITTTIGTVTIKSGLNKRSGQVLSFERLFANVKPFEVLLQYAKQRHLLWVVDDLAQTVRVVEASVYMAEAGNDVTDITSSLDVSQSFKVSPLSWNTREVAFNTGSLKGDGIDGYKDRYGVEYGSKVLVTRNNLNKERKDLFKEAVTASAMMSETYADPMTIILTPDKVGYVEGFAMPLNVASGESADNYGNFYYRRDNGTWADTFRGAVVAITDDAEREVGDDVYMWHDLVIGDEFSIAARPVLRTMSADGLSVLFAPVREQYTSTPDQPTAYLYEHVWQHYVEEVYNAQNKTLEAYLHLPRNVFDKVRKNPLVVLDHVLYLLTEIRSWGEHNTVCRCTLRQITNINNLKS